MRYSRILLLVALIAIPAAAAAQVDLGAIDFPNSGAPAAQADFVRGVLLLHSFEFEDARTAFLKAQETDPSFALAYWGEAMTFNHPLWAQQDRDGALEALAKLAATPAERGAKAGSAREAMYLGTLDVLYGEGDKPARDLAYMAAMQQLHEAYPDDQEARAFYALSILGSVPERSFAVYMRAAALAEEIFARNPRHPGAAHYMIHSYDDPIHAPLGVRAARSYAQIAPAASHAQHMISHIWTALGDWEKVVVANEQAVRVSEERLERMGRSLAGRSKHALLWEEYGMLQQGRFDEAMGLLRTMRADASEAPDRGNLWHMVAMRAAYVVAAPDHPDIPADLDLGGLGLDAKATDAFATGMRALAMNDVDTAVAMMLRIRELIEAASVTPANDGRNAYDGATDPGDLLVADIKARQLEAMLAFRSGYGDQAIELMETAAADEASRALEYGPPVIQKPSHELLGEMLLLAGRSGEAQARFAEALARAPRRTQSLIGLARAATANGDSATANAARSTIAESYRGNEALLRAARWSWLAEPTDRPDEE